MEKLVKNLKFGDKIETLGNGIKTVRTVKIEGKNALIFYNEGGFIYALSDESITILVQSVGKILS